MSDLKRWIVAGLLAGTLVTWGCDRKPTPAKGDGPDRSEGPSGPTPGPTADERIVQRWDLPGHLVRAVWADASRSGQRLEVVRAGEVVWSHPGQEFSLDHGILGSQFRQGDDMTGDGEPNLVIREWSGGGVCCFNYHLVSLGDRARLVAMVEARYGENAGFDDIDGDGVVEFIGNDWTWANWNASFARSPAPRIVLRLRDGSFRLAPDLMQRPAPSHEDVERRVDRVLLMDGWGEETPPAEYWGEALDLLYSGHRELAWRFLEWAWPESRPGRDTFIAEFRARLNESPYYPQLSGR